VTATKQKTEKPVLIMGATGFVGSHLQRALNKIDKPFLCSSRNPERAREKNPDESFVKLDVNQPESLKPAMEGCSAVFYLVHNMGAGGDYEVKEKAAARSMVKAAAEAGVERLIYLGGVAPVGEPSKHLRSRLATGEILRSGTVPCFELRAGMILGADSASWQICRDLAARLPLMLLPRWLDSRSCPIAIEDVGVALVKSLELPVSDSGCYDIPGPTIFSAREVLMKIAELRGTAPFSLRVPVLTPWLSSLWLQFVTRADYEIASEIVLGLTSDLLPSQDIFWDHMPEHKLIPFELAAMRALKEDAKLPLRTLLLEFVARLLTPRA
jgi:uncharacterized protein YbjT (DUF2867 family)